MSKGTYDRRKAQGLCVCCGKEPALADKVYGAECRAHQKKYRQEVRQNQDAYNLCTMCNSEQRWGDYKYCYDCLLRVRDYNKAQRSKEGRKAKINAHVKRYRESLKADGLCVLCAKRKAIDGKTRCQVCNAKERRRSEERRREQGILPTNEYNEYGLCCICHKPLDRDGKACKECAERCYSNLSRKGTNSYWITDNKLLFMQPRERSSNY